MLVPTLLVLLGVPLLVGGVLLALRAPLTLLAVYAFAVPFGSAIDVPLGLPGPFNTFTTLLGLLAGAAVIGHLAIGRRRTATLAPALPVWLLFFGWATLTYVWSIDAARTVEGIGVTGSLILLYAVVALTPISRQELVRFEAGVLLGGTVVGLLAVGGAGAGGAVAPEDSDRLAVTGGGGGLGDPNITAAALLLPLALAVSLAARRGRPLALRVGGGLAGGVIVAAIMLTGSRSGLLGMLAVLAVQAWYHRGRHTVAVVAAVVVTIGGLSVTLAPDVVQQRLLTTTSTGRVDIWRIAVQACPRHCWVGSGWQTFQTVHAEALLTRPEARGREPGFTAHNILVQAITETGVVGLALVLGGLWFAATALFRVPVEERAPPLAALAGVVVANQFVSNLDFKYFWLVLMYATLVAAHRIVAPRIAPVLP